MITQVTRNTRYKTITAVLNKAGDSTHHQDHSIAWNSFRTIKTIVKSQVKLTQYGTLLRLFPIQYDDLLRLFTILISRPLRTATYHHQAQLLQSLPRAVAADCSGCRRLESRNHKSRSFYSNHLLILAPESSASHSNRSQAT